MTKLYAKIKGARAISLFDFPKTWQVTLLNEFAHMSHSSGQKLLYLEFIHQICIPLILVKINKLPYSSPMYLDKMLVTEV